jgi:hypothetical protein
MLTVTYMLSVTNKPLMLSVLMLNVNMLRVLAPWKGPQVTLRLLGLIYKLGLKCNVVNLRSQKSFFIISPGEENRAAF